MKRLEAVRRRIEVAEPLPTKPIEDAIKQAVIVFDAHMTGRPLQIQDPFGKWKSATEQAVRDEIGDHLSNLAKINRRMDACRGIYGLDVFVSRGRAQSSARLLDLESLEYKGQGDGTAVYVRGEGWSLTQKKGRFMDEAHLLVRQR